MTNRFYNLPENIQATIYGFDSTFRDKYDTTIMEMEFLMDEPYVEDYYVCYCRYCRNDYLPREGDRMRRFFLQEFIQKKREIREKKQEKLEKKERIRLENIELNLLELLRRERNFVLDEIKRNYNRIKNNKKKYKLNKNRIQNQA